MVPEKQGLAPQAIALDLEAHGKIALLEAAAQLLKDAAASTQSRLSAPCIVASEQVRPQSVTAWPFPTRVSPGSTHR